MNKHHTFSTLMESNLKLKSILKINFTTHFCMVFLYAASEDFIFPKSRQRIFCNKRVK